MGALTELYDTETFSEDLHFEISQEVERVRSSYEQDLPKVVAFAINITLKTSPLTWLSNAKKFPKFYWCSRDDQNESAACGRVYGFENLSYADSFCLANDLLNLHPQADLFDIFSAIKFNPAEPLSVEWSDFPALSLALPEVILRKTGEGTQLVAVTEFSEDESTDRIVRRLARILSKSNCFDTEINYSIPSITEQSETPNREEWHDIFETAQKELEKDGVGKVVLARRRDCLLDSTLDPSLVVESLRSENSNSYGFIFSPSKNSSFLSVSPECLFRLENNTLHSDALGGTTKRKQEKNEDQANIRLLTESEKISREHNFVVNELKEKFEELTDNFTFTSSPDVVDLSHLHHLCTNFKGKLKQEHSVADVVNLLHPTSAVCGWPSQEALKLLTDLEPFRRGWYAGPVGMFSATRAEFAVALRCMLVRGKKLFFYAGAGLVNGSTPEGEWEEIEDKIDSSACLFPRAEK